MIRDFKAQIFCGETGLSRREIDTADPIWIERIDAYFRQSAILPPDGDPSEYAAAFEAVYPQPRHRRQYIDDAIAKGTPCFGHKVLSGLIAAGMTDCIFTTNFDPLVEDTTVTANARLPVANQVRPTVAAIDSADRAVRCLDESDWPLVAKLHGDYQSMAIKNTGLELEAQDKRMRRVLVEAGKRYGMLFVGYSGRDTSIMSALHAVLDGPSPFPNGLYWLASSATRLLPAVTAFLSRARDLGVDVAVVECATFDELAADIFKSVDLPSPLYNWVMEGRPTPRLVPVQIPNTETRMFPVLRYSALLIEKMPRTARRVTLPSAASTAEVRELLKEKKCRATIAVIGRELAVFGRDQEVLAALSPLGAELNGEIALDPANDSWALGLLYDALVRALARRHPLIPRHKRAGHSLDIAAPRAGDNPDRIRRDAQTLRNLREAYGSPLTGTVPKLGFPFQEGITVKLEQFDNRWWCGFEPYTFIQFPRTDDIDKNTPTEPANGVPTGARSQRGGDPAGDWRRERWAQRYNKNWARIIDAWARLLTGAREPARAVGLEDGTGIDAEFELSRYTGWSRAGHHHPYFDRSR
jgi:hypothetical protein